MNFDELFIDGNKLPKQLSGKEVLELLDKIKQGDEKALEKMMEHNIRLVIYEVTHRFKSVGYDKKDLVSIGNVGLMKAIKTFDISKRITFATYATRCIDNEILMFLRRLKKDQNVDSLDRAISYDKEGNELKIEDIISDKIDIINDYADNETYRIIDQIVRDLPDRDKEIIMLHFGFYDDKTHTQREIADMFSISQSYVSRVIKRIVKKIGKQLSQKGVIELKGESISKNKKQINDEGSENMARELQTIYKYFKDYSKEQINEMLEKLTEEEKSLIALRYGSDLNNPVAGKLSKEEINKFYGTLIPKMKRMLANPNKERKTRKKRGVSKINDQNSLVEEKNISKDKLSKNEIIDRKTSSLQREIAIKPEKLETENLNETLITKEDYLKMLELLKTPTFTKMMSSYSLKEAMIISLKFGYIYDKCFSTLAIAEFLKIEQQEVIDIVRKVLLDYKVRINQMIDGVIQIATEEKEMDLSVLNKSFHK